MDWKDAKVLSTFIAEMLEFNSVKFEKWKLNIIFITESQIYKQFNHLLYISKWSHLCFTIHMHSLTLFFIFLHLFIFFFFRLFLFLILLFRLINIINTILYFFKFHMLRLIIVIFILIFMQAAQSFLETFMS